MRIFNQTNNTDSHSKAGSSCSYCRDEDHQVTSCPHVKSDWALFKAFTIPCSVKSNWVNNPKSKTQNQKHWGNQQSQARWFRDPTGWSKWYAECEKAYQKIILAEQREQKAKTNGKKAPSKCGFCGSTDHNRKGCGHMDSLRTKAMKANQAWRQAFYDKFVGELGISEGALIKVQVRDNQKSSFRQDVFVEKVGIVTSVNWDSLNIGCDQNFKRGNSNGSWRTDLNHDLQQVVVLKVMIDGDIKEITLGDESADALGLKSMITNAHSGSWYPVVTGVISPSEKPMPKEWIEQGHADAVEFVTKKRNKQWLTDKGYIGLVDKWSKK